MQCSIPSTTGFNKITRSFRTRENSLALSVSRACGPEHLRASQQKQSRTRSYENNTAITGLVTLTPTTTPARLSVRRTFSSFGLPGLFKRARLPVGLARTLSRETYSQAHPFACVATARRCPSSPQDRPRGRSLYQVVLPAAKSCEIGLPPPDSWGASPTEVKLLD